MLGVLLLATGLLARAHYGRKSGVRPRPPRRRGLFRIRPGRFPLLPPGPV
jgi:hypothetical protein